MIKLLQDYKGYKAGEYVSEGKKSEQSLVDRGIGEYLKKKEEVGRNNTSTDSKEEE